MGQGSAWYAFQGLLAVGKTLSISSSRSAQYEPRGGLLSEPRSEIERPFAGDDAAATLTRVLGARDAIGRLATSQVGANSSAARNRLDLSFETGAVAGALSLGHAVLVADETDCEQSWRRMDAMKMGLHSWTQFGLCVSTGQAPSSSLGA